MKEDIEYAIELATKEGLYPTLQMIAKGGKLAYEATKTLLKKFYTGLIEKMQLTAATRFIMWCVRSGYLLSSALFKIGLVMGGVGLTWYAIAKMLGVKTPFDATDDNDTFNYRPTVQKQMMDTFKALEVLNQQISEKSNNNNSFTVFLQYFLMSYGWNKSVNVSQPLDADKLNSLYNYNPNKKSKSESDLNKKGYVAYDELLAQKSNLDIKPLKFRYGTFDFNTKKAVMTYQYAKGLKPDGVVGKYTLRQIISDMKTNKKEIKNLYYVNYDQMFEQLSKSFEQFGKEENLRISKEQLEKQWKDSEEQRKKAAKDQEQTIVVPTTTDIEIIMEIMIEMDEKASSVDNSVSDKSIGNVPN